ncbi:histidine phosphatase family protein [Bacillus salitolerans]|uniref:Histidine phosphatase family protein n=1 Tax=Bacillus salitolerans TaxID=1437434 RepID=A0ABW4LYD5_9BACI
MEWKKCISSDLYRAKVTAKRAFDGDIVFMEDLREVKLSPFFYSSLKLPLFIHLLFIRLAWYFNHKSQNQTKTEVIQKINKVIDQVMICNEDTLVVGHGGIMMFMRKELLRRGFSGPNFGSRPENGKLYIFERSQRK